MLRVFVMLVLLTLSGTSTFAQELFPFSEPASNMPTKAIGIRLTSEGSFRPAFTNRLMPEVMIGFNKNLMTHTQAFLSNMDGRFRLEGGSLYAKYRFLSIDDFHEHFRMAGFGRVSWSKREAFSEDLNLEGDNSGWQAGIIATQLIHKLAISGTIGYAAPFSDGSATLPGLPEASDQLSYSLSSGYLLLPFVYKSYTQPNFNLYIEALGKTTLGSGNSYVDLAPALQVIINSRTRIDLGYRFQLAGNLAPRYTRNMYLIRAEFNFFNAIK